MLLSRRLRSLVPLHRPRLPALLRRPELPAPLRAIEASLLQLLSGLLLRLVRAIRPTARPTVAGARWPHDPGRQVPSPAPLPAGPAEQLDQLLHRVSATGHGNSPTPLDTTGQAVGQLIQHLGQTHGQDLDLTGLRQAHHQWLALAETSTGADGFQLGVATLLLERELRSVARRVEA